MSKRQYIHWSSIRAIFVEYTVCSLCIVCALMWWNAFVVIPCIVVIGIRQHALFIMYHEAVHYQISTSKRLNDFIINLFVGVPFLVPVNLYRGLHLAHHNQIGTDGDPEIILYHKNQNWKYEPLSGKSLFMQLAGDLLMWNNFKSIKYYFSEISKPNSRMKVVASKKYVELYIMLLLFLGGAFLLCVKEPVLFKRLLIIWFVPFFTVTQLIQKIRSFTEHVFNDDGAFSGSWKPKLIGKLTIWPYNINYHREHHDQPGVPWDELPKKYPMAQQRSGAELWSYLYSGKKILHKSRGL